MNTQSTTAVDQVLRQRLTALKSQTYPEIYTSYHPDAPFLDQFPGVQSYVSFAEQALAGMKILASHVGATRETEEGVEILCGIRFELNGESQTLFELALFLPVAGVWKYHSAQKLTAEDFSGDFDQLSFELFDEQPTKIRF